MSSSDETDEAVAELTGGQLAVLQFSVLVVALCGIAYELIIATVSSYLLGNSVYQFSITIGLFMFAMGIGSYLTKLLSKDLVATFVKIEIAVSVVGGVSSMLLFIVFPYRVFFEPVQYTLILAIGTLVGLEIPILTRVLSRSESLRDSIAKVLSLDYIGALIGSVSFPLLLLPYLGLFRSSFSIALLNISVALFNVIVFRDVLKRRKMWLGATIAIGVALVAGMLFASNVTRYAEGKLYVDRVIYRNHTKYQRIVLTQDEVNGKIRLYLDGHLQFAEIDEYRYHEALVHPVMSLPGSRKNVAILGGGDGMAIREVLKYPGVERIDLVDLDPEMTKLCNTFPAIRKLNQGGLEHEKVTVFNTDAFTYIRDTKIKYDRVIIDLPDPHNESLNNLYSVEMYKLVRRAMSANGYMVTQSSSPFFTREAYWSIRDTLRATGMNTVSYQITVPSFSIWGFNLAAASGPAPEAFDIKVPTRFLTSEKMKAATVFEKDEAPMAVVAVNSLFEPTLYQLYLKGVRRW